MLDTWSAGYFLTGFYTFFILKSIQTNLVINFLIANGLHIIFETIKKSNDKSNDTSNNNKLFLFDKYYINIITFFIGWYLATKIDFNSFVYLHSNISVLFYIWILFMILYIYKFFK